jgi:Rrf2 family protein
MSSILRISEAAALAIHSMAFLTANQDRTISTKEIASELHFSETHLSKVLQRLSKAGFVKSVRGPKGGFTLGKPGEQISLMDVYEVIDGPFTENECLFDNPIYSREKCILGDLLSKVDMLVKDYLSNTKLSELADWGIKIKA